MASDPHARNTDQSSIMLPQFIPFGIFRVYSMFAVCEVPLASPRTNHSPLVTALDCPNCHSTDLKKISLIHAAGVHESRGRFFGWFLGDGLWFGRYKGTSQSRLSAMLSPPRKFPYGLPMVFRLIGFFPLMAFVGHGKLSWIMGLLATLYVFLLPALPIGAFAYNVFVYPWKYKRRDSMFLCQCCGAQIAPRHPALVRD
jgi:hypothetical protein